MEKDLRKVLEFGDLDGIISETPDHFHAYSAVMAMRAGKAVYVEKPCCFCPEEGQILMRVARETGAVLQVGSQRRASVTYRAAFDYLRETNAIGEMRFAKAWYLANRESIGKGRKAAVPEWLDWDLWQGPAPREEFRDNIVHYNWHWFRKWGTSEMGNNAPHFADVSRWALGLDEFPESVQCAGGLQFPKGGDFEWPDIFNASFKFPGNKLITFELASHCREKPYCLPYDLAYVAIVDPSYYRGHQSDPDTVPAAVFYSFALCFYEISPAEFPVYLIICPVELEKYYVHSRAGKGFYVSFILRQPDAVGVYLYI